MGKVAPEAAEEMEDALAYAQNAKSKNTHRAYEADWKDFEEYSGRRNRPALPSSPDHVALYLRYLVQRRSLKLTTVARRLAAIADRHQANGYVSPSENWVVRNTLRRLRTEHATPPSGKAPLLTQELRRIVEAIPDTLAGARDRAVLLLGFAGATRRSELVNLNVEDLALAPEGLVISINKSKTDQTAKGRKVGIPYGTFETTCPVKAVLKWLELSKIVDGPLFRGVTKHASVRATRLTDQIVSDIVKRYVAGIGKYAGRFGAHSLRAGFITSAAVADVPEREIQTQSGHQSVIILRRYIRDACIFRSNAAKKIGL